MTRKSGRTDIDSIPVVFACTQCGEQVEEALRGFEDKREFICRPGGHTFWLTDKQHIEIFRKHSARIGNLIGR